MDVEVLEEARAKLIRSALRALASDYDDPTGRYYADEREYASELLALAARELVRAVNRSERKPIGW